MRLFALLFAFMFAGTSFGQGTIRGVVKDHVTNEPVPFTLVKVEGQNAGANTDFDGEYEIKIKAGSYTLIFSMSNDGYLSQHKEVVVKDGEVLILNVILSKGQEFVEVIVQGYKTEVPDNRAAADKNRREEKGATDGVTKEEMNEKGVVTVADALQTAPGLSVEDGKNVYVRGLGDRYTKTILNGMEIPGLDPDRNSVQLDIFPASVVDNITVYKTFLPNFAGDYTGGLVDITTKDFPAERTFYTKLGLGYNTKATFNKDYLSYKGGSLDFLGFDDGTRALPVRETDKFPNPVLGDPKLETLTSKFSDVMATEKSSNFLNINYAITYGDRLTIKMKHKEKATYGYNVVLNYRNTNTYYSDVKFSEWRKGFDGNGNPVNELEQFRGSTGTLSENEVMWTALLGQSFKYKRSKVSLSLFHTQNGKSSASMLSEVNYEQNPSTLAKQSLQYSQRSVSNANISGKHYLDTLAKWKLEWKLSPTYSLIKDPDIRSTVLQVLDEKGPNGETLYDYAPAVGSEIRRIWRSLKEYNLSGRIDLTYNFKVKDSLKSEIAFGVLNTYKHRDYQILDYFFDYANATEYSGDPNWYFQPDNIWTAETKKGTYGYGQKEPANTYVASQNVSGLYAMNELPLSKAFAATYGVRVEKAMNWYTGQNNTGTVVYDKELVLDKWSVLPSLNMVYKIEKRKDSVHYDRFTNIRGAYAMTVARPSFKEKSIAQIYDPIQGRTFNGNINLLQTSIHNADLRWEYFFGRTELLSASAFYKRFINPIELVAYNSAPNETQPLNSGQADVYGAEVEIRKALGFKKPGKEHQNFLVGVNFTYVVSKIDMRQVKITTGNVTLTEKEIRDANAREGEKIGNYRPMYGQSPYIVNAFVTYRNDSLGLTLNLNYNVQGKKLAVIGIGSLPDVYEQPFHSLNFKASKKIGKERRWEASVRANNLLMSVRRKYYESFNAQSQVYDYYNQGMTVTGSVSYLLTGSSKKKK